MEGGLTLTHDSLTNVPFLGGMNDGFFTSHVVYKTSCVEHIVVAR